MLPTAVHNRYASRCIYKPGTSEDDVMSGTDEAETFSTGEGNDIVYAGGGDDSIWTSSGNDTIYCGDGNDRVINGVSGKKTLFGENGDDGLEAMEEGGYLDGGPGNDGLRGNIGNDTLIGGDGSNVYAGGNGDDIYIVDTNSSAALIWEEIGGNDTLILEGGGSISLAPIQNGIMGLGRHFSVLLIDLDQDGIAGYRTDGTLEIDGFFSSDEATICEPGSGFIETVGNVSGQQILDYFCNQKDTDKSDQFRFDKEEQKNVFSHMASQFHLIAISLGLLALVPSLSSPPLAIIAGSYELMAWILDQLAKDPPDPNFTTIAEPITPSLSQQPFTASDLGSQQLADAANAMIANQTQWIGVAQALKTSLDRADGAVAAGDEAWQKQQEQAAQKYTLALGALTDPQPQLFADFFNAYQAAGLPALNLTVSDVIDYQNQLRANGLSPEIVETLTELGADSVTQQEILQNLLTVDPNQVVSVGGGVFPNALIDNSFRDSIIASAAAFDQGIIGAGFTDGVVAITIPTPNVTGDGLATGLPPNANIPDTNLITLTDGPDTALPTVAAGQQILGLSGQDNLTGTTAADQINGNQGVDTINGSNGDDTLWGGKGSDQIDGGADNDLIYGNKDNDILNGGDGNDTLHGGQRRDILTGGAGDDILAGELGQDMLTGDAGNDTFILAGGEAAALSLPQADVIMDFTLGDKIGLAGGLAFADLTLETISLSLNNAAAITATALKAGGNYLGIVAGIAPATLTADVFVGV